MNKQIFPVAFLLSVLGGCSLAPTYERPAAPVPDAWPEGVQLKNEQTFATSDWQKYFPDPRLQALIGVALENNRDLRIATARIDEARAQYGIQQADRWPNLDLEVSHNASLTPAAASITGNDLHVQRNDLKVSLVSYELDFWGRVRNLNEAAKASFLATEEAQHAFRFSLIADVADAYLSLLELRQRTDLTRETARTRAEIRDMIARRRELGVSSELDYLQAEGAYQSSRASLADLERQQAAAENLLNLLLGEPLGEINNLPPERKLDDQGITPASIAGLPAEALLRRPDVRAAEQQLIAINASIGAARADFFPRISLTGSFGTASSDLGGLFNGANRAWSFQPSLIQPLFTGGRGSAAVDLAKARKITAVAQYEKTIQQAFREVADLLNASDKLSEQLAAQSANTVAQKERLRLVEARYKAGITSHLEVLDAQRDAYAAEQGEIQVRRMWLSVATQLYKALAGESSNPAAGESREVAGK
jgi:outer membrane protein, multidrug efflux system